MKKISKKATKGTLTVTKADYHRELASGTPAEDAIPPGTYTPRRRFPKLPAEAFEPRNTKVRVTINFDLDVLNFFKERASAPGTAGYQTLINATLRKYIESGNVAAPEDDIESLVGNERLIQAIAVRVKDVLAAQA